MVGNIKNKRSQSPYGGRVGGNGRVKVTKMFINWPSNTESTKNHWIVHWKQEVHNECEFSRGPKSNLDLHPYYPCLFSGQSNHSSSQLCNKMPSSSSNIRVSVAPLKMRHLAVVQTWDNSPSLLNASQKSTASTGAFHLGLRKQLWQQSVEQDPELWMHSFHIWVRGP